MKSNIPIFLSSDNNYAPFVATTIASICDNTKSFCDFYVLDGGITKENQEKICELKKQFNNFDVEFLNIDVEKYFKNYTDCLHYTKTMYARFLIPDIKPEIDKAIYSDVDVIVLGDITQLYQEDLESYPLGAVPESFLGNNARRIYIETLALNKEHVPFASGNLVINCIKWRDENIAQNLMNIDLLQNSDIKCCDQTLLNIYFNNNYKKLSQRYCYTIQHDVCLKNNDVVICHFNGPVKPWHISEKTNTDLMPYLKEFWYYAKMTPFYKKLVASIQNNTTQNKSLTNLRVFRMMAKRDFNE